MWKGPSLDVPLFPRLFRLFLFFHVALSCSRVGVVCVEVSWQLHSSNQYFVLRVVLSAVEQLNVLWYLCFRNCVLVVKLSLDSFTVFTFVFVAACTFSAFTTKK